MTDRQFLTTFIFVMLSIAVIGLTIFGLAQLFGDKDDTFSEVRAEQNAQRIAPIGQVNLASAPSFTVATTALAIDNAVAAVTRAPEEIYNSACAACHAAGVAGAPTTGDASAWAPRIAKGLETLYESTYNGIGIMPARGGLADATNEELRATVDYMVERAQ